PRDIHPLPTRRSSDLSRGALIGTANFQLIIKGHLSILISAGRGSDSRRHINAAGGQASPVPPARIACPSREAAFLPGQSQDYSDLKDLELSLTTSQTRSL